MSSASTRTWPLITFKEVFKCGKFDEEFGYWTQKFFDQVINKNIKLLKSDVVDDELTGSPEFVREFVDSLPEKIIQKVDLLVSWNFKHIVNIERINGYNSVNLKNGFQPLEIRNPREAFDYENNN